MQAAVPPGADPSTAETDTRCSLAVVDGALPGVARIGWVHSRVLDANQTAAGAGIVHASTASP